MFDIKEFPTKRPWRSVYVIRQNGHTLCKKSIAKLYKPLSHYPFTDSGWAYYHLQQLKIKQMEMR